MDGDQMRQATAVAVARPRAQDSPARRLIAWLQILFKAFVHRYAKLARWDAAGRPVFVIFAAFLLQRSLRRRYLSWKESSQLRLRAAVVTVQAAYRATAARRELSLRRQTRAATRIQARWRAHRELWSYLMTKRAALICQCAWRKSIASKQLTNLERLHEMVDVLQQAVDDAEARAIAEREAAKKAVAEAPPVIKETVVLVEDTEKVNSLHAEVARLKDLLGEEMKETFAAKKALAEAELRNEKLARLLGVEEVRNKRLQDSLKRMEEKASNLDEENRMLRQAVASHPAIKSPSSENREVPNLQETPDHEKAANGAVKPIIVDREDNIHDKSAEQPSSNGQEAEKQQELLIKCLSEDLGFSIGRPITAYLIYRCLVHWRSFEEERTPVFDRIIHKITAALEARDNNDTLAYWLSNSCTLLVLLQRTLKTNGVAALARQRRRASPLKVPRENQDPSHPDRPVSDGRVIGGLTEVCQLEAKYPAIAFKQQLTALLEKVYGIIRHNLKKELSPLLSLCIQAPRTFVVSPRGSSSQGTDLAQQASMAHWQSIIKILTNSHNVSKSNYVPPFLICKLFTQVFSFINVQLFNSLLLRRECCSFSNGEYVKAGLDELEHWCFWLTEEYAGSAWDELKHIRQAVTFLILEEKHSRSLTEITDDFCPALSMQQLYRISTMYCDDKYGTLGIPSEVISSMRAKMTEGSSSPSAHDDINSFLLDDDFSIPFSVDDIAKLVVHVDAADMDLPPLIQENNGSELGHRMAPN
ncbi:myosin-17-like isoform X2 [Phragmites australis]|uniref:myosin-17-like isoform X2 n=1 Tax=Phragmites australis TaxID=29695 RepID=UPI002D77BA1C|nr:myosin-17-like isoform X2 [Phragmites australis]